MRLLLLVENPNGKEGDSRGVNRGTVVSGGDSKLDLKLSRHYRIELRKLLCMNKRKRERESNQERESNEERVCVRLCVCARVCEREREDERKMRERITERYQLLLFFGLFSCES